MTQTIGKPMSLAMFSDHLNPTLIISCVLYFLMTILLNRVDRPLPTLPPSITIPQDAEGCLKQVVQAICGAHHIAIVCGKPRQFILTEHD